MGFGSAEAPTAVVATAGEGADGAAEAAAAAVAQYGGRGCAVLSSPTWDCEYPESIVIVGKKGRVTLWGRGGITRAW